MADLQPVLKACEDKLAEAQQAQAELIRKQRELDDAKREINLTVEKRVQAVLSTERDKAKLEAEEGLKLRLAEEEERRAASRRAKAQGGTRVRAIAGRGPRARTRSDFARQVPARPYRARAEGEFGGDVLQSRDRPTRSTLRHDPVGV